MTKKYCKQFYKNRQRMAEISDLCERENREMSEAENLEFREAANQNLSIILSSIDDGGKMARGLQSVNNIIRENAGAGKSTRISLHTDAEARAAGAASYTLTVTDAKNGGAVAVHIGEILAPLAEGLIYDKVGLPFNTGLSGEFVWPLVHPVEAFIAGENEELNDAALTIDSATATPQRLGVVVTASKLALNQAPAIESILLQELPEAMARLINKILMSPAVIAGDACKGPFADLVSTAAQIPAAPTFADFAALKEKVINAGVRGAALAWVMTESQKTAAEATPITPNGGRMICEDNKILGLPVFTASYMAGFIGLGDWLYQPAGIFGDLDILVNPYTPARRGAVEFVLNAGFGTKTLYNTAFALAKVTA